VCSGHLKPELCCVLLRRFIKNNLLVELTTSKYASAFAWLLRRHTFMAYSLYMAGRDGCATATAAVCAALHCQPYSCCVMSRCSQGLAMLVLQARRIIG
jgi:hypothetical protein